MSIPIVPAAFSTTNRRQVASLYKSALKLSLDWVIRRDVWRQHALEIRSQFEARRDVRDPRTLRILLEETEKTLETCRHPEPFIPATRPGGTKFERNLPLAPE